MQDESQKQTNHSTEHKEGTESRSGARTDKMKSSARKVENGGFGGKKQDVILPDPAARRRSLRPIEMILNLDPADQVGSLLSSPPASLLA